MSVAIIASSKAAHSLACRARVELCGDGCSEFGECANALNRLMISRETVSFWMWE